MHINIFSPNYSLDYGSNIFRWIFKYHFRKIGYRFCKIWAQISKIGIPIFKPYSTYDFKKKLETTGYSVSVLCIKWRQNVDWAEFLYHNRILLDFWNRDLKSLKKRIILSEKALSWVNFLFSFYLNRCLYEGCPNYLTRLNYNCMHEKHINNKIFTVVGLFGSFYEFSCEFEI